MAYGRIAKKIMRKGKRYAKKRYMRKGAGYGSGVKLGKVLRDIRLLKGALNTEKKYAEKQEVFTIGQVNGDASAHHALNLLPPIGNGTAGIGQKIGNSIKLTGISVKFQVIAMDADFRVAEGKFRFLIFEDKDNVRNSREGLEEMYDNNQITGLLDYNSERNLAAFKNFRIICNKTFKIPDGNDAVGGNTLQPTFFSRHFALKMNHHVKYDNASTSQISGRLHYAVICDHGNTSTTLVSNNENIPVTQINSGYKMNLVIRSWYVDN
jgi:hypothetical protein